MCKVAYTHTMVLASERTFKEPKHSTYTCTYFFWYQVHVHVHYTYYGTYLVVNVYVHVYKCNIISKTTSNTSTYVRTNGTRVRTYVPGTYLHVCHGTSSTYMLEYPGTLPW
jgi:hypothetical protein